MPAEILRRDLQGDIPQASHVLDALGHPVLVADRDGWILTANPAAEAALGDWIVGMRFGDLFPASYAGLREGSHFLTAADDLTYEAQTRETSTEHFVVSLRLLTAASAPGDMLDLDDLTGVAKRGSFTNELALALERCVREGKKIALLCLDLDRFKIVNDTLGHAVGDLLLKKVADRIQSACRKGDIVGRLGGDEFVVLQQDIETEADAHKLAQRLVDLISRTYILNGHTINIATSVGVAINGDNATPRDMMRDGDTALYESKRAGRGRFRMFEPSMNALLRERREMEIDLRRALALKQFQLHYQPFVDLSTDRVIGFEALLRWRHPVRGNVPPLDFISLAEENGLIVKIGEWVLRTACHAAAMWSDDLIVAVNVSPLQFKAETLLETVSSALAEAGLPAHRLEIEITEGSLLADTGNVLATLNALRALGVHVSMDDFGTGYSSLSYLQKFPFSKIKIDRSFVAGNDRDSEAILRAVASLGTSLGMAITAEGVETPEQLARIREERCTHAQGYLTGRPMEPDRIAQFLSETLATVASSRAG